MLFSVGAVLFLSSGAVSTKKKRTLQVNASFFMQNNDDVMDALASYAEAICIQDKVLDDTPEAWVIASTKCADSYRDDEMLHSSNDGGWKDYSFAAYQGILALCQAHGNADDLCKVFK